jgi:hypothetical protein
MRLKKSFLMASFLGQIICLLPAGVSLAGTESALRIESIKPMPYYIDGAGIRESTDLLNDKIVLRNIIIAPESGIDPGRRSRIDDWDVVFGTTITYVDVVLSVLESDKLSSQTRLSFVATGKETARVFASQDILISTVIVGGARELHVPFLVYGTGCEPLELKAHLHDESETWSELVRTIPFGCGE